MADDSLSRSASRMLVTCVSLTALLWISVGGVHGFTGEVTSVNGGDTMVAEIEGEKHRIRLYGIDSPESGQHGSTAAQRYLRGLALAHPVDVEVVETDVFGRTVAIVRRVGKESSINAAIVANGYAWVNPQWCQVDVCDRWIELQRQARKYRLGIWSGFNLVPPWEFKEQRGP
jgi:endonuclease YncB( thermonuclease family)